MCVMIITACKSICRALSINTFTSHAYGAEMLSKRQSEKNGHKQEEKKEETNEKEENKLVGEVNAEIQHCF